MMSVRRGNARRVDTAHHWSYGIVMDERARGLTTFAPGVWLATDPVRILGTHLGATMAVVELADDELLVFSPVALTPERKATVQALGTVAHLYAPNTYHFMWLAEWAAAFPEARVHGPQALGDKRPDLRLDRLHDRDPLGALSQTLDEVHIDGFLLEESVLVHRPSKTLLVADLVHNIGRPQHWWTKTYSRMMGFYDRVALSRVLRWTAFRDPAAARRSLAQLATCDFDRLVVGHGQPLENGARNALEAAYRWLPEKRALALPPPRVSRRSYCG